MPQSKHPITSWRELSPLTELELTLVCFPLQPSDGSKNVSNSAASEYVSVCTFSVGFVTFTIMFLRIIILLEWFTFVLKGMSPSCVIGLDKMLQTPFNRMQGLASEWGGLCGPPVEELRHLKFLALFVWTGVFLFLRLPVYECIDGGGVYVYGVCFFKLWQGLSTWYSDYRFAS